jgi:hypothetical protein
MRISRREFIVAGAAGAIVGGTVGCSRCRGTRPNTRLSVLVSGLVGMVTTEGHTDLLLVDGDMTMSGAHAPRLYAPTASTASGSIPASGAVGDRSFWDLKNHHVTLASGATSGTTRITGLRRPEETEKPTDSSSHKDVTWVAQMARIPAAGSGRINPQCLANDPRQAKVASRVRFTGGEVAAKFKPPFHQVVWQFGPAGSENLFKQALAEVTLSEEIPTDRIVFRLEPFEEGAAREIVLSPSTGVNLEIELANLPTTPVVCNTSADARNLTHFAAFYQLLASAPSSTPVPSCEGANCPGCPHEGEVVYCPPTEYQP